MTNFDKYFKNLTIESISEFLDAHSMYDDTPWMNWWDSNYCDKCPSIKLTGDEAKDKLSIVPFLNETYNCAYCEVYDKCKYFPDLEETPSMKDIIKMWLEAENG